MTDETPQSEIIFYQTEDGRTRIQCRFENETIWLTQLLIAELFQVTVPTVNEHLKGIFEDGEQDAVATIRKFRIVRMEGKREVSREIEHYNLAAILAVGYRVRSLRGTQFRQCATARLSEYLVKGFVMDDEPIEEDPCEKCGENPCVCEKEPPKPCKTCGLRPCECPPKVCSKCSQTPCACESQPTKKILIKLADGKHRKIQHMMSTTFWHPDGTPMSAQQFIESLYGKYPEFFRDEAELCDLWSAPDMRSKLLGGLEEKGFGLDQMIEMQKIIDAEKSDLFDVLAYVAFTLEPLTREERVARAQLEIQTHFGSKQVFLNFVLAHYVKEGVGELDQKKLSPLLKLKYNHAIKDAIADLGQPEEIGRIFAGFQKYLYVEVACG
ncbi:MAG: virulence RhuM family protein [Planctomycetota bacterium]|nr:virulence RhuM family protein [Planctomycetota bacterium]